MIAIVKIQSNLDLNQSGMKGAEKIGWMNDKLVDHPL